MVAIGGEAVAIGHYVQYWAPGMPVWASALVTGAGIFYVNSRSVANFGSIEYWLSTIKVTAIIVKSVDAGDWFAGGKSLAEQKLASYWIDIHVTEGTNTKDEKAAYLAAIFKRMDELLGPLHEESYAHVDEVKGDAYGFGGLSQERRYIAGKLEVAPQKQAA